MTTHAALIREMESAEQQFRRAWRDAFESGDQERARLNLYAAENLSNALGSIRNVARTERLSE